MASSETDELHRSEESIGGGWARVMLGIGPGIILLFILWYTCHLFSDDLWLVNSFSVALAAAVYFLFIFPYSTFTVPADWAWIMANKFLTEEKKLKFQFSGYRKIVAQKEYQAGFHWRFWWEYRSSDIYLKRQILVNSDKDRTYTLKSGNVIRIEWQVACVPLPGYLVNFARTKEEDIIRRVKTRVENFLQGYVGDREEIKFGSDEFKSLKAAFEELFQGQDHIDEEEKELGIWTGTPEIFDISNPQKVEEAFNFLKEMESVGEAAKKLREKIGPALSEEAALRFATLAKASSQGSKIDFVELSSAFVAAARQPKKPKQGGQSGNP